MPHVKDPFILGYITGLIYAQGNTPTTGIDTSLVSRASSLPNMIQLMMGSSLMNTPPEMEEISIQIPMPILHPETTSV